jgi:hypothetical protein
VLLGFELEKIVNSGDSSIEMSLGPYPLNPDAVSRFPCDLSSAVMGH